MKNGVNARYKNDVLACRYQWQKRRLSVPISMTKTTSSCTDINEKRSKCRCKYTVYLCRNHPNTMQKTQWNDAEIDKSNDYNDEVCKNTSKNDNHRNDDNEDGDNVYNDNSEDIDNDVCDKLLRQIRLKRDKHRNYGNDAVNYNHYDDNSDDWYADKDGDKYLQQEQRRRQQRHTHTCRQSQWQVTYRRWFLPIGKLNSAM